jgi:hypothetical protein
MTTEFAADVKARIHLLCALPRIERDAWIMAAHEVEYVQGMSEHLSQLENGAEENL